MNRTWQLDKCNQVIAAQGTMLATHRRLYRTFKDSLKAVPGCTVRGSSNGVTAGMDGTDRWTTDADLLFAGNGVAHSWIVLRFANMGNLDVLLRCGGAVDTDGTFVQNFVSPAAGYTGGSTTADPTTTDQVEWYASYLFIGSADGHYVLHVPYSSDGKQFYFALLRAGLVYGLGFVGQFEPDVPSAWTSTNNPVAVAWCPSVASGVAGNWSNWGNALQARTRQAGTTMGLYMTCEGWQNPSTGTPSQLAAVNSFDGKWPIYPCGLVSETAGRLGKVGVLTDFAFVDTALASGDLVQLPDGSMFAVFGDCALPWGTVGTYVVPWITNSAPTSTIVNGREPIIASLAPTANNTTPPTITIVSPAPPDGFADDWATARFQPIVLQVTDLSPGVQYVCITAVFGDGGDELVVYRRGSFRGQFAALSSSAAITNGLELQVRLANGWPPGAVTFQVDCLDAAGNLAA